MVLSKGYILSALAAMTFVLLRGVIEPPPDDTDFLLLFIAVVSLSGWFGGVRRAFFLTWAGTTAATLFFMAVQSAPTPSHSDLARFSIFLATGIQASLVLAVLWSARGRREPPVRREAVPIGPGLFETANLQTAVAFRATEKHFHRLATAVPQVFWATLSDGSPDYCNRKYFDAFGLTEETALMPGGLRLTIHPDDVERYQAAWTAALRTGEPGSVEYRLKSPKGGDFRWHLGRFLPVRDESGQVERWFGTGVDIEDQKRAQERLELAQQQLDSILTAIPEPFLKLDRQRRITYVNAPWTTAFGPDSGAVLGRPFWEVFPQWSQSLLGDAYRRGMDERVPLVFEQLSPGGHQWFEVHLFPTVEGVAAHFKDVTDRKRAEAVRKAAYEDLEARVQQRTADLSRLNTALVEEIEERKQAEAARKALQQQLAFVQEEERSRIARELHDRMGQYLTALSFGLRGLTASAPACPRLARLQSLTEVMGHEVHRLAVELRPVVLDDLGLVTAVQNYLDDWVDRTGAEIDYLATDLDDGRLPPPVETAAYRVVQEALTNIERHARAKQVSVVIRRLGGHLHLAVEDNGHGFTVESVMASPEIGKRLGLLGMQERVSQLGGTFAIESNPGKGTCVVARIPLNQP